MWSNEKDLVLTGGEDCVVMAWQPSKQPEKVPIKLNNKIKWNDKRATQVKEPVVKDFADELKELKEAMELRKAQITNGVVESSPEPVGAR